jgi:hypothetical protein
MTTRRRFTLGVLAVLAVGGGLAALWQPGLNGSKLTQEGRRQLGALARALLDGLLPAGDDAALQAHLTHFEETIAAFPPGTQAELQQLLSLTTNAAGRLGLLGSGRSLDAVALPDLQALLNDLRFSKLPLRQQAYFALRDLNMAAFFAHPTGWQALGYPGPTTIP